MRKILLFLVAPLILMTSCLNGEDPKPFVVGLVTYQEGGLLGVGNPELRSNKDKDGNFFVYKALNDFDTKNTLKPYDRIFVTADVEKDLKDGKNYNVTVTSFTPNLLLPLDVNPIPIGGLTEVYVEIEQAVIVTDSEDRRILDLSYKFSTKSTYKDGKEVGNEDKFRFERHDEDQVEGKPLVLRFTHYQKEVVESLPREYSNINSVSLKSFITIGEDQDVVVKYKSRDNVTKEIKITAKGDNATE